MKISAIATLLLLAPVSGRFFRAGGLKRILLEDSETPSARLTVELDADEGIDLGASGGEDPGLNFPLESEGASFGLEAAFGSDTPTYAPTNAPCSICGEGYLVTRPDDKAPVPGEPTCGILQFSAESGDFTPAQCAELLTKELSDACGCEEDVAYEMSAATSGQGTNTPPMAQQENIGQAKVPCSICADGFMVTKPNVAGVDPDDLAITCGDIESAAKKAKFTRDECTALKAMESLSVDCRCADVHQDGMTQQDYLDQAEDHFTQQESVGQERNTPPMAEQKYIGQVKDTSPDPSCSICRDGYVVTNWAALVDGEEGHTCDTLLSAIANGELTPTQCVDLFPEDLSVTCGCEEDVAYEMSEATSGQETNTSITVSCSICADGFMVTKPNVAGVDPDNLADLAITCGDIESAAKKAEFTRDECAALKTMEGLSVTCGCAEDGESHIGIRQPGQSGTEGVSDRSNYKGAIAQGMATSTKADQGPIASSIDGTGCSIGVEIKCIPPTDSEFDTCDDHLTPVLDECDSAPTQLLFKFRGGICDKYEGPQDTNLYMCDDFGSGPATVIGESNYIEAMPPRKVGEPYFSGPVIVGENFVMKAREGGPLEEEILVLVYEDETKTTILQMLVFHTTCDVDLNLDERYGTLKLVGFTDKDLEANMIKTVAYEVTIKNLSNGEFTIEHVVNIADGMKDLLGDGNTLKLGGGGEESIVEEFTVNLMVKRTIQTSVTVSGTQGLDQCVASGEMEIFIPGY